MKALALPLGGCASVLLLAQAALAQGPPVLPTDVTGVGAGSPGYPMLQMQVDNLLNSQAQSATGVSGVSTQAAVIPGQYLLPQQFYWLQDTRTGLRYLIRAY